METSMAPASKVPPLPPVRQAFESALIMREVTENVGDFDLLNWTSSCLAAREAQKSLNRRLKDLPTRVQTTCSTCPAPFVENDIGEDDPERPFIRGSAPICERCGFWQCRNCRATCQSGGCKRRVCGDCLMDCAWCTAVLCKDCVAAAEEAGSPKFGCTLECTQCGLEVSGVGTWSKPVQIEAAICIDFLNWNTPCNRALIAHGTCATPDDDNLSLGQQCDECFAPLCDLCVHRHPGQSNVCGAWYRSQHRRRQTAFYNGCLHVTRRCTDAEFEEER